MAPYLLKININRINSDDEFQDLTLNAYEKPRKIKKFSDLPFEVINQNNYSSIYKISMLYRNCLNIANGPFSLS